MNDSDAPLIPNSGCFVVDGKVTPFLVTGHGGNNVEININDEDVVQQVLVTTKKALNTKWF